MSEPLLKVTGLKGWYGRIQALYGLDFEVPDKGVVTLLGANGAGKTTTLRALSGMIQTAGEIFFAGQSIAGMVTEDIVRLGIAHVPEGRGTFTAMTVEENLQLAQIVPPIGWSLERLYELFPRMGERRKQEGVTLSGGEQQMLAIARILRTGARFLLLDEPTEGLAPVIVQQIARTIHEIKALGYTILLVEQNAHFVEDLADIHYLMENGAIVGRMEAAEFRANIDKVDKLLGV